MSRPGLRSVRRCRHEILPTKKARVSRAALQRVLVAKAFAARVMVPGGAPFHGGDVVGRRPARVLRATPHRGPAYQHLQGETLLTSDVDSESRNLAQKSSADARLGFGRIGAGPLTVSSMVARRPAVMHVVIGQTAPARAAWLRRFDEGSVSTSTLVHGYVGNRPLGGVIRHGATPWAACSAHGGRSIRRGLPMNRAVSTLRPAASTLAEPHRKLSNSPLLESRKQQGRGGRGNLAVTLGNLAKGAARVGRRTRPFQAQRRFIRLAVLVIRPG